MQPWQQQLCLQEQKNLQADGSAAVTDGKAHPGTWRVRLLLAWVCVLLTGIMQVQQQHAQHAARSVTSPATISGTLNLNHCHPMPT
jgi:hypothetical protein